MLCTSAPSRCAGPAQLLGATQRDASGPGHTSRPPSTLWVCPPMPQKQKTTARHRARSTSDSLDAPHARSPLTQLPSPGRACSGQCYPSSLGIHLPLLGASSCINDLNAEATKRCAHAERWLKLHNQIGWQALAALELAAILNSNGKTENRVLVVEALHLVIVHVLKPQCR